MGATLQFFTYAKVTTRALAIALSLSLLPSAAQSAPAQQVESNGAIKRPDGAIYYPSEASINFMGTDISPAQLEDFRVAADHVGISLAEAVDRYAWQGAFVEAVMNLEEMFPDNYAGSKIVDDGAGAWVAFKGRAPGEVRELKRRLQKHVDVVEDRGYSQAELVGSLHQLYYSVYNRNDVADAVGQIDIEHGIISISVKPASGLSDAQMTHLRLELRELSTSANHAVTYNVAITSALAGRSVESHLRGGSYLNSGQVISGPGRCTSGFAVSDVANPSRQGLATAGHCARGSATRWYANHSLSGWTSHVRQGDPHEGNNGDIGWYGLHSALPQFFSSWNGIRSVTGSAQPQVGERLWFFGTGSQQTGQQTAIVEATGSCSGGICSLTIMESNVTVQGDSGGPWFRGNTAVGVHCCTVGGSSNFTPVHRLSNQFGLVVRRA